jgi:uncharacterized OsmC-like protein
MKYDPAKIKTAFERNEKALKHRPSLGKKTGHTKVRSGENFFCDIEDGPWKLTADWDKTAGGNEEGPLPGVYGRASLGVCLGIGYRIWAAKLGVPLDVVEIDLESDIDARGTYGVIDDPPITGIRYTVTIESSASEEDILRVLDKSEKHSPWHNVFANAQNMKRTVNVLAPQD